MTQRYTQDCGCVVVVYGDNSAPPHIEYCDEHGKPDTDTDTDTALTDDHEVSAADLAVAVENGNPAEAEALIEGLNRNNYIHVAKVVRRLDSLLGAYALSWRHSEYWGAGVDFPA